MVWGHPQKNVHPGFKQQRILVDRSLISGIFASTIWPNELKNDAECNASSIEAASKKLVDFDDKGTKGTHVSDCAQRNTHLNGSS